ncbi:BrnT family toxin [soil metagenome]
MQISGFDWDSGNLDKCRKHGVSIEEIESLFTRSPAIMVDTTHSGEEERLRAIGTTEAGRYIFLVFTIRDSNAGRSIRQISARYMHKKEIDHYETENPS